MLEKILININFDTFTVSCMIYSRIYYYDDLILSICQYINFDGMFPCISHTYMIFFPLCKKPHLLRQAKYYMIFILKKKKPKYSFYVKYCDDTYLFFYIQKKSNSYCSFIPVIQPHAQTSQHILFLHHSVQITNLYYGCNYN